MDLTVRDLVTNATDAASGSGGGGCTKHFVGREHDGRFGVGLKGVAQGAAVVGDDGEKHQSGSESDEGELVTQGGGDGESGGFSSGGNGSASNGKKNDG